MEPLKGGSVCVRCFAQGRLEEGLCRSGAPTVPLYRSGGPLVRHLDFSRTICSSPRAREVLRQCLGGQGMTLMQEEAYSPMGGAPTWEWGGRRLQEGEQDGILKLKGHSARRIPRRREGPP